MDRRKTGGCRKCTCINRSWILYRSQDSNISSKRAILWKKCKLLSGE